MTAVQYTDIELRFSDGRKYWALLTQTCRDLARVIWVSVEERSGEQGKDDVLGKLYDFSMENQGAFTDCLVEPH